MDRAISALWRGSDLATLSRESGAGASLQADETAILEEDDAGMISEALNTQVDRFVIKYLFGDVPVKAYIKFIPNVKRNVADELNLYRELYKMGVPISVNDIRERFNLATPNEDEQMLVSMAQSEGNGETEGGNDVR
jgi:hypothetical protein